MIFDWFVLKNARPISPSSFKFHNNDANDYYKMSYLNHIFFHVELRLRKGTKCIECFVIIIIEQAFINVSVRLGFVAEIFQQIFQKTVK